MIIPTWVDFPSQEVKVEVSLEDIRNAILESPDSKHETILLLTRCSAVLKSISDEMIALLNDAQRKVIEEALSSQAARYTSPPASNEPS